MVANRSFSSALDDIFQNNFPNWTVGVTVSYPIGASTAETSLARARLQAQQTQTQVKNVQLQIATQVRDVARQVRTNQQRVKAARVSRELQEKKLEAERRSRRPDCPRPSSWSKRNAILRNRARWKFVRLPTITSRSLTSMRSN